MRNLVSRERPSRGRFRRRRRAATNRSAFSFPTVTGHGPMVARGRADTYIARAMARGPINASRRSPSSQTTRGLSSVKTSSPFVRPLSFLRLSLFPPRLAARFESKRRGSGTRSARRSRRDLSRGAERAERAERAESRKRSNVKGPLRSRFLKISDSDDERVCRENFIDQSSPMKGNYPSRDR